MNIFYLSNNVDEISKFLMDKHCVKMPLESAMMLCSSHRYLDGTETVVKSKSGRNQKKYILSNDLESALYGVSHINHPSTIWTRTNIENYNWHFQLFLAMLNEYEYRYGKVHACTKLIPYLKYPPNNIPNGTFTEPTPAMPKDVIISGDSIASYRNYYIKNKQHLASWNGKINGRPIPEWYKV